MDDFSFLRILVTGGAGFIGSNLIHFLLKTTSAQVVNVDCLTYAGHLESLVNVAGNKNYYFEQVDIGDASQIRRIFDDYKPDAIMHLAAESHVDRSIDGPLDFIQTNVVGTAVLLEEARRYWSQLPTDDRSRFRFHHVSTDEVYGTLGADGLFTENTPYSPNSPYSASKAGSDHLVRAWHETYGLPVVITNCSNNYGPYQFPEKLIPVVIMNAIQGKPLPVYGKGDNVRDWLYVEDHAEALCVVLSKGLLGETYNIGGHNEKTNLEVVQQVCKLLDEFLADSPHVPHESLITYVKDRPGHDLRYAIDATKIKNDLAWMPKETFDTGLRKTVQWYLGNRRWCDSVKSGTYDGQRIGLGTEQ